MALNPDQFTQEPQEHRFRHRVLVSDSRRLHPSVHPAHIYPYTDEGLTQANAAAEYLNKLNRGKGSDRSRSYHVHSGDWDHELAKRKFERKQELAEQRDFAARQGRKRSDYSWGR